MTTIFVFPMVHGICHRFFYSNHRIVLVATVTQLVSIFIGNHIVYIRSEIRQDIIELVVQGSSRFVFNDIVPSSVCPFKDQYPC